MRRRSSRSRRMVTAFFMYDIVLHTKEQGNTHRARGHALPVLENKPVDKSTFAHVGSDHEPVQEEVACAAKSTFPCPSRGARVADFFARRNTALGEEFIKYAREVRPAQKRTSLLDPISKFHSGAAGRTFGLRRFVSNSKYHRYSSFSVSRPRPLRRATCPTSFRRSRCGREHGGRVACERAPLGSKANFAIGSID